MYNGIREATVSDEEMVKFYEGNLKFDLLRNQYLLLKNSEGAIVDRFRSDGTKTVKVKFKSLKSQVLEEVKPRNIKQELMLDLLCNSEILVKCVSGLAGSGKSFLSTAWALQEIQKGSFQKFVIIKNNVLVKDSAEIGFIPGTELEKLKQHCGFITDIITDFVFRNMYEDHRLELAFLATMRGRSISNSIILVTEAQNLTRDLANMIISRVGEGSVIIFDFDLDQIDKKNFEKDNGMLTMVEALKGNKLFGIVELDLIERSEVAKLASLF